MVFVAGARDVLLGETERGRTIGVGANIVKATTWRVEPFCIDRHPFPGEGLPWPVRVPEASLSYGEARDLAVALPAFGRRLCSSSEILLASAGPGNRRYPWGDEAEPHCEPDQRVPTRPIGAFPDCRTPEGVFDLGVRPSWAVLDSTTAGLLNADRTTIVSAGDLALTGGHTRGEAFFATSNYGLHCHVNECGVFGAERFPGHEWIDDGVRICADPGRRGRGRDEPWDAARARFARMEDWAGVLGAPPVQTSHGPVPPRQGARGGGFVSIEAGRYSTCALDRAGEVTCWGHPTLGQAPAPPGPFSALAVGWRQACALNMAGQLSCWGADEVGQSSPPEGRFVEVSLGPTHGCALTGYEEQRCWRPAPTLPPHNGIVGASFDRECGCGRTVDGAPVCWGDGPFAEGLPLDALIRQVSVGPHHVCAVTTDQRVVCWGDDGPRARPPPSLARVEKVASGSRHTCALTDEGGLRCWGDDPAGAALPPDQGGPWKDLTSGHFHSCALNMQGRVTCWGSDLFGQSSPPP